MNTRFQRSTLLAADAGEDQRDCLILFHASHVLLDTIFESVKSEPVAIEHVRVLEFGCGSVVGSDVGMCEELGEEVFPLWVKHWRSFYR